MKAKEWNKLTDDELMSKLKDLKNELFNLRFAHATRQLSNPLSLRTTKKDIARIKTILHERELKTGIKPTQVKALETKAVKKPVETKKVEAKKVEAKKSAEVKKPTETKATSVKKVAEAKQTGAIEKKAGGDK